MTDQLFLITYEEFSGRFVASETDEWNSTSMPVEGETNLLYEYKMLSQDEYVRDIKVHRMEKGPEVSVNFSITEITSDG